MKRIIIPLTLFVLVAAWCYGRSVAGRPTRDQLCRTWMGLLGDSPIILRLDSESGFLLCPQGDGKFGRFTISKWIIDDYDLAVEFVPIDKVASSIRLHGYANAHTLRLEIKSRFFIGGAEYTLDPIERVENRYNEIMSEYRSQK